MKRATEGTPTALVISVHLPDALESLRRRGVPDASIGLPAHITLLYPFAAARDVERTVDTLADVAARHAAFDFRLTERRSWPTALYLAVAPEAPFRSLQQELATVFPGFPLYGGGVSFVPHVTIAEASRLDDPRLVQTGAWRLLPVAGRADAIELLVLADGRWQVTRRFPLRPAGVRD